MNPSRFLYCFNDKAHFRRFLWGLVVLSVFAGIGLIGVPIAYAQTQIQAFSCTAATATSPSIPNGNLFNNYDTLSNQIYDSNGNLVSLNASTTATANGDPYGNVCTAQLGIVGRVLCFFKSTVGQTLSQMYCGFQGQLQSAISVAIVLFLMVMGVMIMTGMVQFTVRESMMGLLKVALIYAFATNATWGIGIGYAFFMGLAEQGSALVLGAGSGGGTALTQPDQVISGILNVTTLGTQGGNGIGLQGLSPHCSVWLITFFFVLFIFVPVVAVFIGNVIVQYLWLYARALLGYLTALILIAFLFVLAPLFISFALFQITRPLFEQWIKYLTTFSLQMIVVFAFLAILNMIPVGDFFTELLSLLKEYDTVDSTNHTSIPSNFCGICAYTINNSITLADYFVGSSTTFPITCNANGSGDVIQVSQLLTQQPLIQAIVSQATALWIIGSIMQDFMIKAPDIAKDLTGRLPFAAALGAGGGAAGDVATIQYAGLETAEQFTGALPEKLFGGSSTSVGGMARRAAFATGMLGATGMLDGVMRRMGITSHTDSGGGDAADSHTSLSHDAVSNAASLQNAKTTTKGKDNAKTPTIARPDLGAQPPVIMTYETAYLNYTQAHEQFQSHYDDVQKAMLTVEQLKPGDSPAAHKEALAKLKQANDSYRSSWSVMNESQAAMFKQRKNLESVLPDGMSDTLGTYMGTQDSSDQMAQKDKLMNMISGDDIQDKNSSDSLMNILGVPGGQDDQNNSGLVVTVPKTNDAGLTSEEMRGHADQTIQYLQMQATAQHALSDNDSAKQARVSYAANQIQQAIDALAKTNDPAAIEAVMKQLRVAERALS